MAVSYYCKIQTRLYLFVFNSFFEQARLFALEDDEEHHRVLFHVEDHRPIRPAEKDQGNGGRV